MSNNTYLSSKPRYEILDGLRGVAAMLVVAFHMFETYAHGQHTQIINHGYLAVDFFFALSGFVIGYAYDDRWDRMTTWGFFKRRLVRLQPLVIMGTVIGACFYFFQMGPSFPNIGRSPAWMVALAFVMGCLMIPCGPKMDIRGWGEMNSFNGPNWSLTWEYLANILYAFIFRRLPKIALAVLTALAGFLTLDICLDLNVFGLLTESHYGSQYTVIGGWCLVPEQMYIGFTRLMYPFLSGLLVSRIGRFITLKGGFWWCSVMLVAIFAIPCIGGAHNIANGVYNAAAILLLFPVIVMIGAGSRVTGEKSVKICNFLGEISYPLYITHFPFALMQWNWGHSHPEMPLYAHVMVAVGCFVFSLGVAYASLKLYDIPVRKWLTENWLKRK